MEEKEGFIMPEQKESVKLTKTTKGYTWEIKMLEINLSKLEEINSEMKKRFPNEE